MKSHELLTSQSTEECTEYLKDIDIVTSRLKREKANIGLC